MKRRNKLFFTLLASCALCFTITACGKSSSTTDNKDGKINGELTISAAASLKEAMADIEKEFKSAYPDVSLTFNFGASGSLQQQIEQGAPCDVFISAGQSQMKALDEKGLLLDGTKKDLVRNSLVLVGPSDSTLTGINDLNTDAVKKIAVGEPSSVPAGKYADEVFTSLEIKDSISSKLVFAKDVKEVLAWTVSGNADAGFVYKSDAISSNTAKIIQEIPEDTHSPIKYPTAVIKDSKNPDTAKAFEDFLFTEKASEIFNKYGYTAL